ncbi:protein-disulfide reductase DsbD family protein [Xanthomarina sp. F2636L]|uniref:protein-disulfide reductase DsbD family protein n=1 Tax=Xanthomarina sp. F2636L TaxID=2996018 RepID=UPI00225E0330|nr:thioredoxin family protein [Xanthomarina sp. F2636L]MCX7549833.1 thioredoxin family protein [Xanthomarina sp. F2636L]
MKYKLGLIITLFFAVLSSQAQVLNPVTWTAETQKISETEYQLVFKAEIEEKWHLYSQDMPEGGALPTEFIYDSLSRVDKYNLVGKTQESKYITAYDKVFEMDLNYFDKSASFKQKVEIIDPELKSIEVEVSFQACDDVRCIYQNKILNFDLTSATQITEDVDDYVEDPKETVIKEDITPVKVEDESKGLLSIFFTAFFLGFLVLLTPCVFPMIPMTVSFFTKQSKTRAAGIKNALLYGFFIIVIYTLLGTAISALFGSNAMYEFSTGVTFNAIMFIALIVFAFSFMGAFEIMLPNSWVNKVDSGANRGGIAGIFFMALALAVVSFSCTFPIAGTALLDAATKGGIAPIISMLGFSSAIALPFGLFAFFPSWLNSLPKSGGWLNTVKVVLGFLELAFAFKFLSMIDLVLEWHFLEREVFIAIWIAIFGTLGLYLLGKIRLPHDSPLEHLSVGRLCMAMLTFAFTFYMIPGLWGAPLKLISGFPPPMSSHSESPYGVGFMKKQFSTTGEFFTKDLPEDAHFGPNDLIAFKDYDKGMAYAKKVNKPVMLDFTGLTCVNCRKMEEQVWVEDQVYGLLDNDIVLISLYVDDRTKLPKEEQYESELTGNKIRTYGQKWLEFQQTRYNTNAQPLYIIQDLEGKDISAPVGYTPEVDEYYDWLKKGIENFKK